MVTTTTAVRELNDAELIAEARKGDADAYGELYRRHIDSALAAARALTRSRSDADDVASEAFARVLRALQNGGGPDVSFRPYLVTAVRNVFYDKIRRNREEPSDDMSDEVNVALLEAAKTQEDGAFASAAYASLPERWQLVLWHTEVEGRSVSEVAPMLGLAPNAVAALAYRAREGLRQAYLQAHLRDQTAEACRECASQLGAYVRDGLSARDRRRIDAHLDECASCSALVVELTDTNNTLRAALIPALVGVSASAYLSGLGGKGVLSWLLRLPKKSLVAAGGGATAGLVATAMVVVGLGGGNAPSTASATTVAVVAPPATGDGDGEPSGGPDGTTSPASSTTDTTEPTSQTSVETTVSQTVPVVAVPPTRVTTTTVRPQVTTPRTVPGSTPATTPTTPSTTPATTPATTPTTTPATIPPTAPPTTVPAPPVLTAVATQRSVALANGQVRIEVAVTNTGAVAANGLRLDVPAPAGTSFLRAEGLGSSPLSLVEAFGPGWTCTGAVSCTLAGLPAGQSSLLMLTFGISPSAPSSVTISPVVAAPVGANVTITPVTVTIGAVPGLLAAETARGRVVAIGNTVTTCNERASSECEVARDGLGDDLDHNDYSMQYVNTAGGTFNSSSAALSLSGSVSRAFLVWGGDVQQSGSAPNSAARNTVTFITPSGSSTVTAAQLKDNPGSTYFAVAEVTSLVTGAGTYAVADVQTALGAASFGGWSLVVVEHDASLPERFMVVTAPLTVVSSTSADYSFAVDLHTPMVDATAGVVVAGFEGERSLDGETVTVSGATFTNPFSGRVPGVRNPSYENTLGTDLLVTTATGLDGSQLTFTLSSPDDRVMLGVVALSLVL